MRLRYPILLVLLFTSALLHAQSYREDRPVTLHIGDAAPPLRVQSWLKGDPIPHLEKGKVYVIEFWATWCAACRAVMPRTSVLAKKFRGKVNFIGMNIMELEKTPLEKIKRFVDSMGSKINYHVATDDSGYMATNWYQPAGGPGLPGCMVVNQEGQLAWIGHIWTLDKILPKILNNTWDIAKARAEKKQQWYLDSLDLDAHYRLISYRENSFKGQAARPDLTMVAINSMIIKEPKLKYAPRIAYETMATLLQTDMRKACRYGREAIKTTTYEEAAFFTIIGAIANYENKLKLTREIYLLGADAYQTYIDWMPLPEVFELPRHYSKMAEWYWRAHRKSKAIRAQQKAIEEMKSRKDYTESDLAAMETKLKEYRDM